jgi:hypothetical protein
MNNIVNLKPTIIAESIECSQDENNEYVVTTYSNVRPFEQLSNLKNNFEKLLKRNGQNSSAALSLLGLFTKATETLPKIKSTEDAAFRYKTISAAMYNKKKVAIIYNYFSLDAMMASAVMKSMYLGCKIFSSLDHVVLEVFDKVIWIGIDPYDKERQDKKLFFKKDTQITRIPNWEVMDILFTEQIHCSGLFETACYKTGLNNTNSELVKDIGYCISMFETNDLNKDQLVFMWVNIKNAEKALCATEGHIYQVKCEKVTLPTTWGLNVQVEPFTHFEPRRTIDTDYIEWNNYIQDVKRRASNSFSSQVMKANGKSVRAIMTSHTNDHFWVTRLLKLAHKHVVNLAIGPKGVVVHADKVFGRVDRLCMQMSHQSSESY